MPFRARANSQAPSPASAGAWAFFERHHRKILVGALALSLLIHILSGVELNRFASLDRRDPQIHRRQTPVKVRIVEQAPKKSKPSAVEPPTPDSDRIPKIIEVPQVKTQPPKQADHAGNVDHRTEKETKISELVKRERAKDAGQKGLPKAQPGVKQPPTTNDRPTANEAKKIEKGDRGGVRSKLGQLSMDTFNRKPRNDYEALLPSGVNDLPGQLNAGYQDFIDDKIQTGDRIDINTSEYRFIGYFTNMRKAIELVWNYPLEAARRGMQGEVGLEFTITKDGHATHIKVLKSSGYQALDQAIAEAIRLASPFAPLPEGFKRNRLVVTGSFRYILNSYGSH